jgi:hypothetical protein
MKTNKELANILTYGIENKDIDMIWWVVGELEKEVA